MALNSNRGLVGCYRKPNQRRRSHRRQPQVGQAAPQPFKRTETEVTQPYYGHNELEDPNKNDHPDLAGSPDLAEQPKSVPVKNQCAKDALQQVRC